MNVDLTLPDDTPPTSRANRASERLKWPSIVDRAAEILADTLAAEHVRLTLRGLHYRLVSEGLIPNTQTAYKRLSELTAQRRRDGEFPALHEGVREIVVPPSWDSPTEALRALAKQYRRDRTEGQPRTIILGVEKRAQADYLTSWYGAYGLPVVAMAGYASQTLVDRIEDYASDRAHPDREGAVLLYAGDFDPSGEDMLRDLRERLRWVAEIRRVALTAEQVAHFELPEATGKAGDSRAAAFAARHGRLAQVELEALPPSELHRLYDDALSEFWDVSAFQRSRAREEAERNTLIALTQRDDDAR